MIGSGRDAKRFVLVDREQTASTPEAGAEAALAASDALSPLEQGAGQRISTAAAFLLAVPVPSPWTGRH